MSDTETVLEAWDRAYRETHAANTYEESRRYYRLVNAGDDLAARVREADEREKQLVEALARELYTALALADGMHPAWENQMDSTKQLWRDKAALTVSPQASGWGEEPTELTATCADGSPVLPHPEHHPGGEAA